MFIAHTVHSFTHSSTPWRRLWALRNSTLITRFIKSPGNERSPYDKPNMSVVGLTRPQVQENEKALRYIGLLENARLNGDWPSIQELCRKVDKHAPHRKCMPNRYNTYR